MHKLQNFKEVHKKKYKESPLNFLWKNSQNNLEEIDTSLTEGLLKILD